MARWLKAAVKGRRWRELAARLSWMGIVGLLIYGVQHLPVSMEWKIAIGEGIGIFGGVELILDVIRGLRMEREIEELRLERNAARQENEETRRERDAERREKEELRRRVDVLEAIVRATQERENEELRRRVAELESIVNTPKQPGSQDA